MRRETQRTTQSGSSAASDGDKRQYIHNAEVLQNAVDFDASDDEDDDANLDDVMDSREGSDHNTTHRDNMDGEEHPATETFQNLAASIQILQETLTDRALVWPQYLTGKKGMDAIGNVHRDHVMINLSADSPTAVMYSDP